MTVAYGGSAEEPDSTATSSGDELEEIATKK